MPLEESRKQKHRIGEVLLDYGLITPEQLTRALDRQIQSGMRLGSVLEEMGYLECETLLNVLSRQHGLPHVDLSQLTVSPEILKLIPFEQVKSLKALPFNRSDNEVSVAMVDPVDNVALQNIESAVGGAVRPFIVSDYQMHKAISVLEKTGYGDMLFKGVLLKEETISGKATIPDIFTLFKLLIDFKATDLHLVAGAPPSMRIGSDMKRLSMPNVSAAEMKAFISEILTEDQMEGFNKERDLNMVLSVSDVGRFRINIYKQRNSISLSAHLIHEKIPSITDLNLPEWISEFALRQQGLILIAGLAGQGKTATIASLVNEINSRRKCNILTLEDPIEYFHKHKMSNVNQREIGIDTESFADGLKHIVRLVPDVIVIGDLRDPESISLALNAAETGHLVIGSINSLNSTAALERIMNIFPDGQLPQIRMQLANTLLLLFSQKLIPHKEGESRLLAFEKITGSSRIANLIRNGNVSNIRALMQVAADDVASMDHSIAKLCLEGKISFEDGLKFADSPAFYQELISTGRL